MSKSVTRPSLLTFACLGLILDRTVKDKQSETLECDFITLRSNLTQFIPQIQPVFAPLADYFLLGFIVFFSPRVAVLIRYFLLSRLRYDCGDCLI